MSSTMGAGSADKTDNVATNETAHLIAASKVNGTSVYNRQGESLGSIHDVIINKSSGQVEYVIMSFGGFLGMGESYHPLPWSVLTYDERQGGYIVNVGQDRLRGAPAYTSSTAPNWSGGAYSREVDDYYGISPKPGAAAAGPGIGAAAAAGRAATL